MDLARTVPTNAFLSSPTGLAALRRVLLDYAAGDAEVGYCQGMSFVAGALLIVVRSAAPAAADPVPVASRVFRAMLRTPHLNMRGMYKEGMAASFLRTFQFESVLQAHLPKLWRHLQAQGLETTMYLSQWTLTLFAYSLPFDMVVRVWDLFLFAGWSVFFGVALAVMEQLERALLRLGELDDVVRRLKDLSDLPTDRVVRRGWRLARTVARPSVLAGLEAQWTARVSGTAGKAVAPAVI